MKCIICDKPVTPGANICSTACAVQFSSKIKNKDASGNEVDSPKKNGTVSSLSLSIQKMASMGSVPFQEIKMIKVKHRWMKNRNLVSNNTVLSFDKEGIALIKDLGNAIEDIKVIIRKYPGQMELISSEEVVESQFVEKMKNEIIPKKKEEIKDITGKIVSKPVDTVVKEKIISKPIIENEKKKEVVEKIVSKGSLKKDDDMDKVEEEVTIVDKVEKKPVRKPIKTDK